jgi:uncharacterized protein (TIGR03067 family)
MAVRHLIACAVLVLAVGPVGRAADDHAAEYKKAEGTWLIESQETDGAAVPADFLKPFRAVMKGDTYTLSDGEKEVTTGTYKIVAVKGKTIQYDFTIGSGPDKGVAVSLLAEWVDDDTYRTCARVDRKGRPTEFASKKGSGQTVAVYKRVKK